MLFTKKNHKIKIKFNEFKKFRIKNRTCYYFTIKLEDFDLNNILIYEKSLENILICDISYKTLINLKPLQIRFDNIDRVIRFYDGTRYLRLSGTKRYDAIYNKVRYLIKI